MYISSFLTYIIGFVMLLLLMLISFTGYILPWGQMSYWAVRVITNTVTALPLGYKLLPWLWGSEEVGDFLLRRIYLLHILLPFLLIILSLVHITSLHKLGSSNISVEHSGIIRIANTETTMIKLNLHPYISLKDSFILSLSFLFLFFVTIYFKDWAGNPVNAILSNNMKTPSHIIPEWYFLVFYAMLKLIPHKTLGLLSIIILLLILGLAPVLSNIFMFKVPKYIRVLNFYSLIILILYLTYIGASEIGTFDIKFGYIFIILLLLNLFLSCILYSNADN